MNTLQLVTNYLHTLQQRGVTRLGVDDDARRILRTWMKSMKRGRRITPSVEPREVINQQEIQDYSESSFLEPETSAPIPDTEEDLPFFRPAGDTVEAKWNNMLRMLPTWQPLRELGTLREHPVPGTGNHHASIMFVGDAPNYYDERDGAPFMGKAGEKLDGILRAMNLSRQEVYITHLVKFRPAQPRQTINTRPPTDKEIRFSSPILDCEIKLVQPRVIVALGVIAARGILRKGELPLAAYQAKRDTWHGIPVVVTHHPSYLLRTSDLAERRQLWEEMLGVMELAGLPINEKQRHYFLPKG